MNSIPETNQDPLVAALPPATDYITYLTLLEYQLTPDNLSTLNKLLSDDDGTLAAEIGWDLLKLVLPMLQIVPEEANKCLNIIARRGNPREVVVRVAEELERLGPQEEEEEEDEDEDDYDHDGLPTFAGEAPRIHLGQLKLDGMPEPASSRPADTRHTERPTSSAAQYGSDDILILKALVSMLSIVHPRIKTQYPSRFLATSLPAALDAYRRIAVTAESTLALIEFLSKLSGKKRPVLPPRISTTGGIPTTAVRSTPAPATTVQAPPLPDPEANTDPSSGNTESQLNDKAITERLLQAIMLEVLDEYTASFQTTEHSCMSWTTRLREKHEPSRVLPQRPTETQRWTQSVELQSRDNIIARFLKLANDLNLKIQTEFNKLVEPTVQNDSAEIVEQEDTDYPTSPSQIPFSTSGLILLFAAHTFAQDVTGLTSSPPISLSAIRGIFRLTFAPSQDIPHPPSLSQTDAILSLIYTTLQSPLAQPAALSGPPTTTTSSQSQIDLPFLTNLTNLFTTSPDPSIRDSTHHLTSLLLHNYTDQATKLLYIKSLLAPNPSPASPIHDIQQGNLRALAVNWLKDEFITHTDINSSTAESVTLQAPTQLPSATSSSSTCLDPAIITADTELVSLIFPSLPTPPSPIMMGHPAASSDPSTTFINPTLDSEADFETFLLQLPFFIASLNLICILASIPSKSHEHDSILSSAPIPSVSTSTSISHTSLKSPLASHIFPFITTLSAWNAILTALSSRIARNQSRSDGQPSPVNISDIYALEDAVNRAKGCLEKLSTDE